MQDVFERSRVVEDIRDCEFYHSMDLPGYGPVTGLWDLRGGEEEYLGGVDFKGKRVLELGTASGYLCFYMERKGAEVIAHDVGDAESWEIVPYSQYDHQKTVEKNRLFSERLKNAYWLAHKNFGSKARVIYGSAYNIPDGIGTVDICTFGSILLHLNNPFRALQGALKYVSETAIVTDMVPRRVLADLSDRSIRNRGGLIARALSLRKGSPWTDNRIPYMVFLPDYRTVRHIDAWWALSPQIIINFLGLLGFEKTVVTYHTQKLRGAEESLFTVVGTRTRQAPA